MLPALELDGKMITESDVILKALEKEFGPVYAHMEEPRVQKLRHLGKKRYLILTNRNISRSLFRTSSFFFMVQMALLSVKKRKGGKRT